MSDFKQSRKLVECGSFAFQGHNATEEYAKLQKAKLQKIANMLKQMLHLMSTRNVARTRTDFR